MTGNERTTFKLELSISRVQAFTYAREINIQIYRTVYLKKSYTRVHAYSCMHLF